MTQLALSVCYIYIPLELKSFPQVCLSLKFNFCSVVVKNIVDQRAQHLLNLQYGGKVRIHPIQAVMIRQKIKLDLAKPARSRKQFPKKAVPSTEPRYTIQI